MNIEQLKRFIEDSRYYSETEKCAVARAPWCDDMRAAFACLDEDQRESVNVYRKSIWRVQLYALGHGE